MFYKRTQRMAGILCILLIGGILSAEDVCSISTVDQDFTDSTFVFSAKILNVKMNDGEMQADAEVLRIWKGTLDTQIRITRKKEDVPCAIPFQVDGVYLVYAEGPDHPIVRCCSTILPIEEAGEDIARIEDIRKTEAKKSGPRDPFAEMKGDSTKQKKSSVPSALNVTYAVVVGIVNQGDEFVALIRAMNGKVYSMKVGDRLSDGKVLQILTNRVVFLQRSGSGNKRVEKKLHPFPQQQ